MRKLLLLQIMLFIVHLTFGQALQVTGTVLSTEDGFPMPGVNVVIKETPGQGTTTDIDGSYSINVSKGQTLVFSFIGCNSVERLINLSQTLNISLEASSLMLEEVVTIGYGTMKKSDLTGSVASISSDKLKQTPVSGLDQALQGRAAGVTVNANSGQPGAPAVVRIRGIGTVNNSDPLYVVDGVILGDIGFLSPNDIASTEILKDASATAIYGSRGANGVILITTKRGSDSPRSNINFDAYFGVQNRWRTLDVMGRDEFARTISSLNGSSDYLKNEAGEWDLPNQFNKWIEAYHTGKKSPYFPVVLSDRNPNGIDYRTIDTDWQDEVFQRNATIQNYHVSIDGGNQISNYAVSGSYFDQQGTIMGSNYNRFTFRINSSHKVNKWLKIGENLSFMRASGRNAMNNNPNAGASILSAALAMAPWDPTHYPIGATSYTGKDLGEQIAASSNFKNVVNPFSMVQNSEPISVSDRWVGDFYVEISPIKGLLFRSDVSIDFANNSDKLYKKAYEYSSFDKAEKNFLSSSLSRYSTVIFENTLSYNTKINLHEFSALIGITSQEYNYYSIGGSGASILNPVRENWYLSQTTTDRTFGSDVVARSRMVSGLSRLHYTYDNRYMVTVNFRIDGSDKFPENLYGYFPSMALGWRISEEGFLKGTDHLDFLKLRAGWGQIGNDKINNDVFITKMFNSGPTFVNYVLGTNPALANGATVLTFANKGGRWETTEQTNIGVDFGFFNGLLSGNIDLFLKDTKDMLLSVKAPAHVGNRYDAMANAGTVRNQGIEISLDHRNNFGDFNYSINGNVSFIKNEITALNGGERIFSNIDNILLCDQGLPINTIWGYKYMGVFKSNDEAINYVNSKGERIQPDASAGDAKYEDRNDDGKIDDADKANLGSPFPWLTYGLSLSADYKGFDLQLFFQGVYGNSVYNALRYRTEGKGEESILSTAMNDVWTMQNTEGSIANPFGSTNNFRASSRFVEDGSYLRLKNIQLGYTIPKKLTRKVAIERCRLYVSASNLFTITKYTGYDPEVGGGVDFGNYPQPRTVLVGASVNF